MQLFWEGLTEAFKLIASLDPLVLDAAWRSLLISVLAVVCAGIPGVLLGSLLARKKFAGRRALIILFRAGMSIPTVLIGLLCFGLLSRRGPLGELDLLYTQRAILIGEFFLALPIIVSLTYGAVNGLDKRVAETAKTLGAGPVRRWRTYLSEARLGIVLALLTAFARCFTELGIAMMVGGNIRFRTRTLTTATALETSRGEFSRGVAMSLILLAMAVCVTVLIALVSREGNEG